jgi:quinol-cytochrome oxidoreductase complex cytochrome b subunit
MGAGIIFFGIFMHICRGLFYGSGIFPNLVLWLLGFLLYIFMMAEAFTVMYCHEVKWVIEQQLLYLI